MKPARGTRLVEFAALDDPGAKGFSFGSGRDRYECFVVRWRGVVLAYDNVCPHARTSLDWQPDAFFTLDKSALQCATHGAQFDIANGHCFLGPCKGRSLTRLPVAVDAEGWVVVV
ncbi:Rieske (2Fe-2S) protein [Ferrovibrio sp.]|uniref:Rieske (2Fe-2S) protein n=1 Tax=Ferrovibrio sp. TaxID=1917215 RepID=UPI0035B3D6E9